jgi:hypothetical protein
MTNEDRDRWIQEDDPEWPDNPYHPYSQDHNGEVDRVFRERVDHWNAEQHQGRLAPHVAVRDFTLALLPDSTEDSIRRAIEQYERGAR